MIKLNGHLITPTIFPDKTSQVWKLPEDWFLAGLHFNTITWEFENEAEFMHVAQLQTLLQRFSMGTTLELPYLPYARQDKDISNVATFSLHTFATLLNSLRFAEVKTFDPHNAELSKKLINNLSITMPNYQHILWQLQAYPVFPDKGAALRYGAKLVDVVCDKIREPLTGAITGISISGTIINGSYLIIDDICDGGRTFIEVAKKLYEAGAKEVHLYVSHGIFSKGLDVLHDAGIKRIFTRNGEVSKITV